METANVIVKWVHLIHFGSFLFYLYNPILHTEASKGLHRHKNTLKNKVTYIVKQEFKKQASHHKYTRTQTYKYINKNKPYMRSKHGNVRKETILGVTKQKVSVILIKEICVKVLSTWFLNMAELSGYDCTVVLLLLFFYEVEALVQCQMLKVCF